MKSTTTATTHPSSTLESSDSSTFSLESLAAATTAVPAVATPADDSGLFHFGALRAAGSNMTLGGGSPLLPAASPSSPPARTPRWAIAALGALTAAVAMLGVVALAPSPSTAIEDPRPEPSMAAVTYAESGGEGDATMRLGSLPVIPHAEHSAPVPAPEVEAEAPAKVAVAPRKRSRKKSSRRSAVKKSSTAPAKPTPATAPAPAKPAPAPTKPSSNASSDLSVDCILDPASCGHGARKSKPKAPKPNVGNLPDKLSSAAIRTGLSGPKSKAKQCKAAHGAAAGTTVKVKLSIAGSGSVRSATPQAPHANALGRCVADALAKAEFTPFAKPAMGVVYSVRL